MLTLTFSTGAVTFATAQKPQYLSPSSETEAPASDANEFSTNIFEVGAGSVRYHTYRMSAGERVRIELSGDGDTDLDMYVYSSDGVLIDKQEGSSDDEASLIRAYRPGTITVKIVNRGDVYNRYSLTVWGD
jgi:hypothetical protein